MNDLYAQYYEDLLGVQYKVSETIQQKLPRGTIREDFLRDIVQRLVPGGSAAINIFKTRRLPKQRHRLEQLFTITDTIYTGGNVVFHMHPHG